MSLPLVSIIIPVYNQQPDFLRECLQSAISQTYSNLEIIVSDNHSTNKSFRVIEGFADYRLKIIRPVRHLDITDHFKFAAAAATGEYITFLSSDDLLYPECIAKVVQPLIEDKALSFSYCENAIIDGAGNRKLLVRKLQLSSGIYPKKKIAFRMYDYPEYWIIGGVIRQEHYKKVGLVKEIRAGDWILGLQLLKYGDVAYCNEVLSAIRYHERKGEAKQVYAEAHELHNIQRATKHEFIIQDRELLDTIGMSKERAMAYKYKEIVSSVIVLVRQYHNQEVNKETINKIFGVYKQNQSGFSLNFLARYYPTKLALFYTYILSLSGRINKMFLSKK